MQSPDSSEAADTASLAIASGSKIVVWELSSEENNKGPKTFDPYPEFDDGMPVSSLAWNHNQMVIATSSGISTDQLVHDNVVLLSSQSGQVLDSFQHDLEWKQKEEGSTAKCVSFGGKSRYLCIGDESGAVCLWDLKKKIRVRQFFHSGSGSSSPSLQVSLDRKDTYVFSLSPSALYQYNLRDGQLVGKLLLPRGGNDIDVAHFTMFAISDLEPNLMAIGADDGSVYIHDISNPSMQALAKVQMAQTHSGEVTGLAFSPTNPNLLFSCGADGTILVHNKEDRTSRRLMGALQGNHLAITTMSLHANGTKMAVGFQSRDVCVYELHSSNGAEDPSLLASFRAGDPVRFLSFAPPPRAKDKQKQSAKTKSSNIENATVEHTTDGKVTAEPTTEENNLEEEKPTVDASSSTQSSKASVKEDDKNEIQQPTKAQQKPASPKGQSSPFARRLAAITKNAKQKSAAATANNNNNNNNTAAVSPRTPLSPRRFNGDDKYNIGRIHQKGSPVQKASDKDQIRDVVREEVENLQDEMEEQLRNLHIDMINQFHQQSQEIENVMSKHFQALERLTAENQQLREENERLRRGLRG